MNEVSISCLSFHKIFMIFFIVGIYQLTGREFSSFIYLIMKKRLLRFYCQVDITSTRNLDSASVNLWTQTRCKPGDMWSWLGALPKVPRSDFLAGNEDRTCDKSGSITGWACDTVTAQSTENENIGTNGVSSTWNLDNLIKHLCCARDKSCLPTSSRLFGCGEKRESFTFLG